MTFRTVKPLTITLPPWAVDRLTAICLANGTSRSGQILKYIAEDDVTALPPAPKAKKKARRSRDE